MSTIVTNKDDNFINLLDICSDLEYNISENLIALSRVVEETGPMKPSNLLRCKEGAKSCG